MKLIDADALAKELMHEGLGYQYNRVINAPAVDAVPVIRCKDCKYAKRIEQNDDWWECSHDKRVMHGDGFCSWGERK